MPARQHRRIPLLRQANHARFVVVAIPVDHRSRITLRQDSAGLGTGTGTGTTVIVRRALADDTGFVFAAEQVLYEVRAALELKELSDGFDVRVKLKASVLGAAGVDALVRFLGVEGFAKLQDLQLLVRRRRVRKRRCRAAGSSGVFALLRWWCRSALLLLIISLFVNFVLVQD